MATRIAAVTKDGLLQQIDSPLNRYNHPGSIFTAGFIGSPSMNFFDVTLVDQGGKLFLDGGTFRSTWITCTCSTRKPRRRWTCKSCGPPIAIAEKSEVKNSLALSTGRGVVRAVCVAPPSEFTRRSHTISTL